MTTLSRSEPLARERVLKASIASLDAAISGFRSSTTYLLDSDSAYASELLHLLCVRAVAQFEEEVIWIDGGNTIEPYALSAICKRLGLERHETLSMVNVARAFTAYQLVSLIDSKLCEESAKSSPAMIIVSSISDLFMDKDMKWTESYQLLKRCAKTVAQVTEREDAITLVTARTPGHVKPDARMASLLHSSFDVVIQMRGRKDRIEIRMPAEGRAISFTPTPWNQTVLYDFMEGSYGTDRAHIPPRA